MPTLYIYAGQEELEEIEKNRGYLVVKSNQIIQKARYALDLAEQKTIAYICAKIKPAEMENSPYVTEYSFDIREYCKTCGIDYDSGGNYAYVKSILKGLRDKSMWITLDDGSEVLVGWLSKVRTNKGKGTVYIKLDEDLLPYLFGLKQQFTQYELIDVLTMRSAYSIRLYELLKSYSGAYSDKKTRITFDPDELKRLLFVEEVPSYKSFGNFWQKCIEPALKEIYDLTPLSVTYELLKEGRGNKVTKVTFEMYHKTLTGRLRSSGEALERLEQQTKIKGLEDMPESPVALSEPKKRGKKKSEH